MKLTFLIGLIFSPLAAIAAFLITYEEYSRHYTDRKTPFWMAFESAFLAFLIFMALSFVISLFF